MSTLDRYDLDGLVADWLISKWVQDGHEVHGPIDGGLYSGKRKVRYSYEEHGPVSELRVVTADADWECGCWSSWTREDDFILTARIETAAGEIEFQYGKWGNFPQFIEELHEFRNNETCSVENRRES